MNKRIIAVFFCTLICYSAISQRITFESIHDKLITNTGKKYIDSLQRLLTGTNLAASLKPANRLLTLTAKGRAANKSASSATFDPCGYLCSAFCPAIPTWIGTIDSNYFNGGNWCTGKVPSDTDIVISSEAPYFPVITKDTVRLNSITIISGGRMTIKDTGVLKIKGAITSDSALNAIRGTVVYAGTLPQTIAANTYTNNTVKKLVIANAHGVLLGGELKVVNGQKNRVINDSSVITWGSRTEKKHKQATKFGNNNAFRNAGRKNRMALSFPGKTKQ